ncbi:hypothetical protein KTR66_09850 [Roseococcus sp. SDR]|uniref:hypothetical protein n=1 Tax=Roseococcus sp. SDR TaxID=2835532 RepID=UPI001BCD74B0|nr:hypothetical protein [Roseococcus sp. SDR]MBS7790300.1 hypothetical protein [Roseococcus sp. SDR]MBV1845614.1 hypothetical protein [Roseococcus sp. SDR]
MAEREAPDPRRQRSIARGYSDRGRADALAGLPPDRDIMDKARPQLGIAYERGRLAAAETLARAGRRRSSKAGGTAS